MVIFTLNHSELKVFVFSIGRGKMKFCNPYGEYFTYLS